MDTPIIASVDNRKKMGYSSLVENSNLYSKVVLTIQIQHPMTINSVIDMLKKESDINEFKVDSASATLIMDNK